LQVSIGNGSVNVSGSSGFYVPESSALVRRLARRGWGALRQPLKALTWISNSIASRFAVPRLMSYDRAFDAVMSHAEISMPILSRFVVNHLELLGKPGVFATSAAVDRHYRGWSGYAASPNILNHYYYQNILRGCIDSAEVRTVLEIGAGNGNFPSILYHDWAPVRVILIDLPETLAVAIPFLSNLFPRARLALPHEIQSGGLLAEFDFAFLTVDQLGLLGDDRVDLAINCHSFQEMTHEQIRIYIELAQRVCRDGGYFFTANRIEKIPCGPDAFEREQPEPPNRAAEYPWNPHNEIRVQELSRLMRLVQLDGIAIRLERIRKGPSACHTANPR
jgi:putative sugar O-methyltransferase